MIRAVAAGLLTVLAAATAIADDSSCFECHETAAPDGTYMPIVRAAEYAAGVHRHHEPVADVGGGDEDAD